MIKARQLLRVEAGFNPYPCDSGVRALSTLTEDPPREMESVAFFCHMGPAALGPGCLWFPWNKAVRLWLL